MLRPATLVTFLFLALPTAAADATTPSSDLPNGACASAFDRDPDGRAPCRCESQVEVRLGSTCLRLVLAEPPGPAAPVS